MRNPAVEGNPATLAHVTAGEMEGCPRLHPEPACPCSVREVAVIPVVARTHPSCGPGGQSLAPQAVGIGSHGAHAPIDERAGPEVLRDRHFLPRQWPTGRVA